MMTINYLFDITLCWLFFYGFYIIFLQKETFFNTNRIYLIASLIIGLVIPKITFLTTQPDVVFVQTVQLSVQNITAQVEATAMTLPTWQDIFWTVYIIGVLISLTRMLVDIHQIFKIFENSVVVKKTNHKLVITNENHPPFSFFNYLFISNEILTAEEDSEKIIAHELAHISGGHTFDVLLSEILCVLFWFNPLVYWYKKSLQDVHEYLADYEVTRNTSIKKYGHLLMRQALPSVQLSLSNHFNHSQLKKRIRMMTKKQSSKWAFAKYALALPMIILMAILFSAYDYPTVLEAKANQLFQNDELKTAKSQLLESQIIDFNDPIYNEVDEMPRFPGCEEIKNSAERENCSQTKLLTFIYTNIKYPEAARKKGTQGLTVVEFVVQKDGSLSDFKTIKALGDGCDEAALKTIKKMAEKKWIPGVKDGKKVAVRFKIPVKFKLANDDVKAAKADEVDEMPRFPGCDEGTAEEKTKCSNQKMIGFIVNNLKYPEEAKKNGVDGMVVISFVVNKKGEIVNIKNVKSIGNGCDEAAMKVVNKMQKEITWVAGKKDGKTVAVEMKLPFKFKLDKEEDKK